MGGRWQYSSYFVGYCFQDLFNKAHSILVQFLSSLFSIRLVNVHVEYPYCRIDTTAVWKKLRFILSDRIDFYMVASQLTAVHAFTSHLLMSFSEDETLLPRYVNYHNFILSTKLDTGNNNNNITKI